MTKRPGYLPVTVESRIPSGTGPLESLHASGIEIVKVSEGEGAEVETE